MLKGIGVMRVRLTKKESCVMLHADKHFEKVKHGITSRNTGTYSAG